MMSPCCSAVEETAFFHASSEGIAGSGRLCRAALWTPNGPAVIWDTDRCKSLRRISKPAPRNVGRGLL